MGQISLGQGEHFVYMGNTTFFRFKTLMLETDSTLPWPEDEQIPVVKSSIWEKLLLLGLKFLLVCAAACVLYVFRARVNAGFQFLWRPVCSHFQKVYWFLPDEAWVMLWYLYGGVFLASWQIDERMGFKKIPKDRDCRI